MLIGLLPFGDIDRNINTADGFSNTLLGLNNYQEWATHVSERANRDAIPKVASQTIEKFLKLNEEIVNK